MCELLAGGGDDSGPGIGVETLVHEVVGRGDARSSQSEVSRIGSVLPNALEYSLGRIGANKGRTATSGELVLGLAFAIQDHLCLKIEHIRMAT